ncbi:MAG TPA: histone deacetylase [bacterium]|nr:histone deacetylase [bacterium]
MEEQLPASEESSGMVKSGEKMKLFYSEKFLEYYEPGHPEAPARLKAIVDHLARHARAEFEEPRACPEETLLLAHSAEFLNLLKSEKFFERDSPALPGIYRYAVLSCGSALQAMQEASGGQTAFSLARPPGHHAGRCRVGGFCYLNNMAVAALAACQAGRKVAVIDLDGHHGNGTEEILRGRENVIYVSLHQVPAYPGTGLSSFENCYNFPLPPGTGGKKYLATLDRALKVVAKFSPEILGISLGLDTHECDPLLELCLKDNDYRSIGFQLSKLGRPAFVVLEGGYDPETIGHAFHCFLQGLTRKETKP